MKREVTDMVEYFDIALEYTLIAIGIIWVVGVWTLIVYGVFIVFNYIRDKLKRKE
jgi:hypothetical protein